MGDAVHLETDVLFKYVENIMNHQKSKLTEDKLRAFGFRRNLYALDTVELAIEALKR